MAKSKKTNRSAGYSITPKPYVVYMVDSKDNTPKEQQRYLTLNEAKKFLLDYYEPNKEECTLDDMSLVHNSSATKRTYRFYIEEKL